MMLLYGVGLYKKGSLRKLSSCYKCAKLFFAFKRYDSVTRVLMETGMPGFDTLLHNSQDAALYYLQLT